MKKLSHTDYCDYYASKCKKCNGAKRVRVDKGWVSCHCQHVATLKYRFEQFEIYPPTLKYKSWTDFCGYSDGGNQRLTPASFVEAKSKAFAYCFGSGHLPQNYENILKERSKHLIVHKHCRDGQNVVIVGDRGSGRTLIAALIIKEVAHACMIKNLDIGFKYINANDILSAARWDNSKSIDHDFLNEICDTEFLVIDQIDLPPPRGHHTNPPDCVAINKLFADRVLFCYPTIAICSTSFWSQIMNPRYMESVVEQWGREFVSLLKHENNVVVELCKEIQ